MSKVLIDNIEVTEEEYLQRIQVVEEESDLCEEFIDLLDILEISPQDETEAIDDFVSRVSCAYLNFLDFYDTEYVEEYIC